MGDWWNGAVEQLIQYGPFGLFAAMIIESLGIPFPGDAVLAFYGFLASRGHMVLWHLSLAGTLGCLGGSLMAFAAGRKLGPSAQKWLTFFRVVPDDAWPWAHRVVHRYGPLMLVFGRFLPGFRALGSYIAGMSGIPTGSYLWWSTLGFAAWAGTWILLGFQLGQRWEEVLRAVQSHIIWIFVAGAALALLWRQVYKKR